MLEGKRRAVALCSGAVYLTSDHNLLEFSNSKERAAVLFCGSDASFLLIIINLIFLTLLFYRWHCHFLITLE